MTLTDEELVRRVRAALNELASGQRDGEVGLAVERGVSSEPGHRGRHVGWWAAVAAVVAVVAAAGYLMAGRPGASSTSAPVTAAEYELNVPGARPTDERPLTAATLATAVWGLDGGYLHVAIRPGSGARSDELPGGGVTITNVAGRATWISTVEGVGTAWWRRPNGDLWIVRLHHPDAGSLSASVIDWMQHIKPPTQSTGEFVLNRPGLTLMRTDTGGDVHTTTRTWRIGDAAVVLSIASNTDATGFANMLDRGLPTVVRVAGRNGWRVEDPRTGEVRISWDADTDGSWASLTIPTELRDREVDIVNALTTG